MSEQQTTRRDRPHDRKGRTVARFSALLGLCCLLLVVAGWVGSILLGRMGEAHMRDDLLARALELSLLADPAQVQRLSGEPADLPSPEYRALYSALLRARSVSSRYRDVYLFGVRRGQIVFLLDTDTTAPEGPVTPGTPYEEASTALQVAFHGGSPFVEGPARDRWGSWVSALIPVADRASGRVVAVLGVDMSATHWLVSIWLYRLTPPVAAALLIWLVALFDAGRRHRRVLAERMRTSEEQYRGVVESIREVVFQTDPEGRWTYLNPAWTEITGFSVQESLGSSFLAYVHPDDRDWNLKLFEPLIRRQKDFCRHAVRYLTSDGGVRWLEVDTRLTFGSEGQTSGTTGTLRDVSERHHAEEALLRQDQILQGIARASSELLAAADHEHSIPRALAILGEVVSADLVSIHENCRDASAGLLQFSERFRSDSSAVAAPAVLGATESRSYSPRYARWEAELSAGRPIRGIVADLPESERAALEAEGVVSLLLVPISCSGAFWGFMGLFDTRQPRVWLDTDLAAVRALAGNVAGTLERQATLKALRESEEFARAIFDTAQVGIVISDAETSQVIDLNRAAIGLIGLSREAIVGRDVRYLVRTGGQAAGFGRRVGSLEQEAVVHGGDGSETAVLMTGAEALLNGHKHVIECFVDISSKKRLEDDLRAAMVSVQAASAAKSDFLANMSHEIRTPLNGVIGMSNLLLETELDERQRRYARTVAKSGSILLDVINDVLDFSKIEAGKIELEQAPFCLPELIEEIADTFSHRASVKGLELVLHIGNDVPVSVIGDRARIRQVLCNLIGNALKFTAWGEVVVRCALLEQVGDTAQVAFAVSDTGIGIPGGRCDRLFSAFTQVDASTTRQYGGTGLGLAISKRLVDAMGGEIAVESTEGSGSTFSFHVPLAIASSTRQSLAWSDPVVQRQRVLVVDDNAVNRQVLLDMLAHRRVACVAVNSAAQALDALACEAGTPRPFSIALIDQRMPGGDGMNLASLVRSKPEYSEVRLVLMTSIDKVPSYEQMRTVGLSGHLTKPLHQGDIIDVVGRVAAGRADDLQSVGTAPRTERRMGSGHILLAEDNDVNQMVVSEILEQHGYTCEIVSNGRSAVLAVRRKRYDLVLMDCQMPEMDGYEATDKIRAAEAGTGEHLPIVALTANATKEVEQRCLDVGMDAYVSKPVEPDRLLGLVEQWSRAAQSEGEQQTFEGLSAAEIDAEALAEFEVGDGESGAVAPAEASEDEVCPLDREALVRRLGGNAAAAEGILARFCAQLPADVEQLTAHSLAADAEAFAQTAHRLKGSSGTVGAEPLRALAEQLQYLGEGMSLEAAPEMLERLRAECQRLADYVQAHTAAADADSLDLAV